MERWAGWGSRGGIHILMETVPQGRVTLCLKSPPSSKGFKIKKKQKTVLCGHELSAVSLLGQGSETD